MFNFKKSKQPPLPEIPYSSRFLLAEGRNLKEALSVSINALEKDIFDYNWVQPNRCNCGVIVQAILGIDRDQVEVLFEEARQDISILKDKSHRTWREVCQQHCSVTGMPTHQVFHILGKHGFNPEDIVHLEYMTNPAILEISEIDTLEKHYYQNKANLIKYLKAWLSILNGTNTEGLSERAVLEAELLVATSGEHYEAAAKIRDQIVAL